jgi:hypothetical protein
MRLAPHRLLRNEIIKTLRTEGQIVSVFRFLIDHDFFGYAYGLRVFYRLEREGIISMIKSPGRGQPWQVIQGRNFPCQTIPVSIYADSCAAYQPPLLPS